MSAFFTGKYGAALVLTALISDSKHVGRGSLARESQTSHFLVANNNYALAA